MSSRRGFEQQCKRNTTALVGQDVVSTTGRLGIHGFNANLSFYQGPDPLGLRKPDAVATAENNQLDAHVSQLSKVFRPQILKAPAGPVKAFAARANDHTGAYSVAPDSNPAGAVAADRLRADEVGLNFHVGVAGVWML